jgi:rhodanese-related sulfurtransferase
MQSFNWKLWATILSLCLVLISCAGQSAEAPAGAENAATLPQVIDVQTAQTLHAQQEDIFILDVREEAEYAEGHIPGATLIPLGQLPNRLSEVPPDKTIIAVCRSGNRSGKATDLLRAQGFDNVHNMQGGMLAWGEAGYDVEK